MAIFATAAIGPLAQAAYTVEHTFTGQTADGANPAGALIADGSGNIYGTTSVGGAFNQGAVFEWAAGGPETVLYSFTGGPDGGAPEAGLTLGPGGVLYGTTYFGGIYGYGVVFALTPGTPWTESVLHTFTGVTDGASPWAGVTLDPAGNLYGTTTGGGLGFGVVFELTPGTPWTETVLYPFTGGSDGANPYGGVILDSAHNIYGTASYGGAVGYGVVFKITPAGLYALLHTFSGGADGANPVASLVEGAPNNFYGTTPYGGSGYGVVFKVPAVGVFTVLHTFTGGSDGAYPFAGLIYSAPELYGVTYFGGTHADGTVFRMTTGGVETVLHSFAGAPNGDYPFGGLVRIAPDIYGTTYSGGNTSSGGVLFKIT
jgi:uncharacterized repeat protein (TIGR03803 family)